MAVAGFRRNNFRKRSSFVHREPFIPCHIRTFAHLKGMSICQRGSQRFYGPAYNTQFGYEPEDACEIFFGGFPRNILEPELLPVLESVGPVFQLRLFVNFSGSNKGFCFVKYFNQQDAVETVYLLNNTRVFEPKNRVSCWVSADNRHLIFAGVPTYKTLKEIKNEIRFHTPGVVGTQILWPVPFKSYPKGLVRVSYENHRAAALARKAFLSKYSDLWGYPVTVDWATPDQTLGHPRKKDVLVLRNVSPSTTFGRLMARFRELNFGYAIDLIKRIENEAFIYFCTREQAEVAKLLLDNTLLDGNLIEVTWCDDSRVKLIEKLGLAASRKRKGKTPS